MLNRSLLTIAIFLVTAGTPLFPARLFASELKIHLKSEARLAPETRITVGDVANVTGGNPIERRRISELDLETLDREALDCRITRRQIEFRVLVDGHRRNCFQIIGPEAVLVRCSLPRQFRGKLEELMTEEIARQFGLDQATVVVRLVNEPQIKTAESRLVSEEFSATVLFPAQLPIGKTRIQVEFLQPGGNRFLQEFESQVILSREVALAKNGIPKGTVVDRNMIIVITRPILSHEDFAEPEQVIGQVASRDIASNEVVLSNYIAKPDTRLNPLVKRNDVLDVVVKVGRNEIRLKNAKAISAGSAGESIIVLNPRSGIQFSAIVVNRNLAEVASPSGGRR